MIVFFKLIKLNKKINLKIMFNLIILDKVKGKNKKKYNFEEYCYYK